MSLFSLAQRTALHNGLFAGLACAIALTVTAGPALAQAADLGRVEVRGRVIEAPVRYDVHTACNDLDGQLQGALGRIWEDEARYGEVKVQLFMENGEIGAVQAKGISSKISRGVRNAVSRLDCGPRTTAAAGIYHFSVDFIDPRDSATRTAGSNPAGVRVAVFRR